MLGAENTITVGDNNFIPGFFRMTHATVKWFNPAKGFGFVTFDDGTPDAFLHISVVERAGYASLGEGTSIECEVGQGRKGPQIEQIFSVKEGPRPAPSQGGGGGGGGAPRGGGQITGSMEGIVKWFNPAKGFGFVQPDTGGKDIFLHISVVERAGINALPEGQRVKVGISQGQKGPQAESIELL
jgi:cold shock protein